MKIERPKYILKSLSNGELPELSIVDFSGVFGATEIEEIQIGDGPFTRISTPQLPHLGFDTPKLSSFNPGYVSVDDLYLPETLEDPLATPRTSILKTLFTTSLTPRPFGSNSRLPEHILFTPRTELLNSLIQPTTPCLTPRASLFPSSSLLTPKQHVNHFEKASALSPYQIHKRDTPNLVFSNNNIDDILFKTPLLPIKSSTGYAFQKKQDNFEHLFSTPLLFPSNVTSSIPDILEMIEDKCPVRFESSLRSYEVMSVTDENVADYVFHFGKSMDRNADTSLSQTNVCSTEEDTKMEVITGPVRRGRNSKRLTSQMERRIKEKQREKTALERKEAAEKNKQKRKERFKKIQDTDGIRRRVQRGGRCTRSLAKACKQVGLAKNNRDVVAMLAKHNTQHDEE